MAAATHLRRLHSAKLQWRVSYLDVSRSCRLIRRRLHCDCLSKPGTSRNKSDSLTLCLRNARGCMCGISVRLCRPNLTVEAPFFTAELGKALAAVEICCRASHRCPCINSKGEPSQHIATDNGSQEESRRASPAIASLLAPPSFPPNPPFPLPPLFLPFCSPISSPLNLSHFLLSACPSHSYWSQLPPSYPLMYVLRV